MYPKRIPIYKEIEQSQNSKVIAYITGDRRGLETHMSSDVLDFFVHHLDQIGVVEKISLILYTRGGDPLSAWSIANLLRTFCDQLEVIIPSKCYSAGTLLCLGADTLVMTKQATLGPIDPSVNTLLNPQPVGGPPTDRVPVSVENINAFLEHAQKTLVNQPIDQVFDRLAQNVHPLVLGAAFRARSQIRMLGERLLSNHMHDKTTITKILDFLCSESYGHDYTINRREARQELQLPIETPSWEFYNIIKRLYDDIALNLELTTPYDANAVLRNKDTAEYSFIRVLIESVDGGAHAFVNEGTLNRQKIEMQPNIFADAINNEVKFEGWRHENARNI